MQTTHVAINPGNSEEAGVVIDQRFETRGVEVLRRQEMAKHGVATISPSTPGGGVRTCAADLSRARHQFVLDATMAST